MHSVLMETHQKLWLAIFKVVRDQCYSGEVGFPVSKYDTSFLCVSITHWVVRMTTLHFKYL